MPGVSDAPVHRREIEALLSTVTPGGDRPLWARDPQTPAQFFASILHLVPTVTPVYDADGWLLKLRGIALREGGRP